MVSQKRALVTGASEGIGQVFAKRLSAEGYQITAIARNEARLRELLFELEPNGHSYLVADLSTLDGIDRIVAELAKNHYHLLINNAGGGLYAPFYQTDLGRLQAMTRLNCDALVSLSHAFLNQAQPGDALINVSSGLAFMPLASIGLYCATKAFVLSLSESLWYEQKSRGILVMGLCPGATSTNFHSHSEGSKEKIPPQMITQTPEEVVETGLRALKKRNGPTVISGPLNLLMTMLARLLPRKILVLMMNRN